MRGQGRRLALVRRARQPPSSRPTLKESRFEDAATRRGATRFLDYVENPREMNAHNRLVGEVTDILREIKSRSLLERLLPYLSSPDLSVRHRAAQGCLRIAEQQAVTALEAVAAEGTFAQGIRARDRSTIGVRGYASSDRL